MNFKSFAWATEIHWTLTGRWVSSSQPTGQSTMYLYGLSTNSAGMVCFPYYSLGNFLPSRTNLFLAKCVSWYVYSWCIPLFWINLFPFSNIFWENANYPLPLYFLNFCKIKIIKKIHSLHKYHVLNWNFDKTNFYYLKIINCTKSDTKIYVWLWFTRVFSTIKSFKLDSTWKYLCSHNLDTA